MTNLPDGSTVGKHDDILGTDLPSMKYPPKSEHVHSYIVRQSDTRNIQTEAAPAWLQRPY
jgi:hypothetical protein